MYNLDIYVLMRMGMIMTIVLSGTFTSL